MATGNTLTVSWPRAMSPSRLRFLAFFLIALAVLSLAYGYAASRVVAFLPQGPWRGLGWFVVFLCLAALPLTFFSRAIYEESKPGLRSVAWVGYIGLGLFSLLITFFALRDLVALVWRLAALVVPGLAGPHDAHLVWINAGVTALAVVLFVFGFASARRDPRLHHVLVPIADLHPDLVGFRILQLSDVHIGPTIRRAFIERLVAQTLAVPADAIAITGDLVDGSVRDLLHAATPLRELTNRPVFFVTGNHEYYSGANQWNAALSGLGIRVLSNEHVVLHKGGARIVIAGVNDITAHQVIPSHRSDPFRALAGAVGDLRVMLAHQPRSVFAAAEAGADLVLSGHTHAGQYFPGTLIVRLVQPFVVGLARHRDTQVYVSPGTGYWGPPLRLGTRSEITLLELTRAVDLPAAAGLI